MATESNPKVRKAEAEAGPASAKKAKVTPEADGTKGKKAVKKNAMTSKGSNDTDVDNTGSEAPFAWKASSNDSDAFKRLEIKEEAVREGFRHADRIRSILVPVIEPSESSSIVVESGTSEIRNWVNQLDELKKQDSEFRVFIGFAGVTGAGKTSAINSIIDFRDLLPSSNEAAATAVPCLIAYNDSTDPDTAFRAEVTFKTEQDLREDLDRYFDALKILEEACADIALQDSDHEPSASAAKERMARLNDLEVAEQDNQDLLDMVSAVFGLDEVDLKAETTESLLAKHPDVQKLLGQTISVVGRDVDDFSASIKPYMDSVAAVHGTSGVEFAAWPLINEVKVFVRSNVLKNGIVLVDLPGLADNVESRAVVAQNYFSKLSVTAIVAPIIRARNEQTAVNLMTENQQYCMQMDGKFHKKSFCVILSKMDDINVETHLKQHSKEANSEDAGALQSSQASLKILEQQFKELEKEKLKNKQALKSIARQYAKLQAEDQKAGNEGNPDTTASEVQECNKQRIEAQAKGISLERQLQVNRKEANHLKGKILHWCIHGRNASVKKEIQKDFQKRQQRLAMVDRRQDDLYDGTVNIFPISSSAYWRVSQDTETPVGFPAKEYTGIPALQHWLRYAAIPDREKHLDMVLNGLHGMFNTMETWSSEFQGELSLDKKFVINNVLHKPLHYLEKTLNTTFNKLCKQIRALDPMKNKESTIANCKERCVAVVKRWSSKEPDNMLCRTKMHWHTYNACITRDGGVFRAKSQGRHRYAWIESLCNLFYEGIVKDWNLALNEEIPRLRSPTNKEIDQIWDTLMQRLEKRIQSTVPQIKPRLAVEKGKLEQIKEQLKDMVGKEFGQISIRAAKAHRTITTSVKKKWELAFKKAKNEKGKGRFERQQLLLIHHAEYRGSNMFKDSTDNIGKQLADQLGSLRKEFHTLTEDVRIRVRDLIIMMLQLDGTVRSEEGAQAVVIWKAPGSKQEVQRATRVVVLEWAAKWRIGSEMDVSSMARNTAIPEIYYDEVEEVDDSDGSTLGDKEYREFVAREEGEDDF